MERHVAQALTTETLIELARLGQEPTKRSSAAYLEMSAARFELKQRGYDINVLLADRSNH